MTDKHPHKLLNLMHDFWESSSLEHDIKPDLYYDMDRTNGSIYVEKNYAEKELSHLIGHRLMPFYTQQTLLNEVCKRNALSEALLKYLYENM